MLGQCIENWYDTMMDLEFANMMSKLCNNTNERSKNESKPIKKYAEGTESHPSREWWHVYSYGFELSVGMFIYGSLKSIINICQFWVCEENTS